MVVEPQAATSASNETFGVIKVTFLSDSTTLFTRQRTSSRLRSRHAEGV